MPKSVFKEEEENEEKRKEREKKHKEQQIKEEVHHSSEIKKDSMQKSGMSGMSFGDAKPLTEIGYMKIHIKGTRASEKYEPVVKELLAVKLIEDEKYKEMEKEKEMIADQIQKHEQEIRKEEEKIREQRNQEIKELEKETVKRKQEIAKMQEKIKKEREQIKKLLDETRAKGMVQPIKELAKKLIEREIKQGSTPRIAIGRVLLILKRLGLIKTKKEKKNMINFLKSLFKKK